MLHTSLFSSLQFCPSFILRIGLFYLLLASSAWSQTVNWSSTASTSGAGNKAFLSDGSAMPAGFTFQLGYFSGGFNAADPNTWLSNWNVYDDSSSGGIEGQSSFSYPSGIFGYSFSGSVTNTLASFDNQQGYIWGFNNSSLTGNLGGEAILVTASSWLFPAVSSLTAVDWGISNASTVVWGSIDQNVGSPGGRIDGGGIISAPATTDLFHMQTATFAAPVPEPSGVVLVGGVTLLGALRRRRHRYAS